MDDGLPLPIPFFTYVQFREELTQLAILGMVLRDFNLSTQEAGLNIGV